MQPQEKLLKECKKDLDVFKPLLLQDPARLAGQLRRDADFLADRNILDYSLLVGVRYGHVRNHGVFRMAHEIETYREMPGTTFPEYVEGPTEYCFGIIDVLQEYVCRKRCEYWYRSCRFGEGVSCVPPRAYAERFKDNIVGSLIEGGAKA